MKLAALILVILSATSSVWAAECVQKIKKKSIKVEWTGYKTTEKVGVTGKFEKVRLLSEAQGATIHDIVKTVKFSIDGMKFDAGNWVRNKNLKKHFFKKFADSAKMSGSVKAMPDTQAGELTLVLEANGVRGNIPMKYKIDGKKFVANGTMEMSDLKLDDAFVSIAKACFKLHKGKDGVSKTWTTVDLMASAEFEEVCK